ncbi:RelA/SpoT family protein [Patescibacteria group bacterium]|nr:RelA/SpoT family protein [Patescibacteria group bacterium]
MPKLDDLLKVVKENNKKADLDLIRLAYDFAEEAHKGQKRLSGEPYIIHPLHTAITLAEMKADHATIIAGLLHDVPEDTDYSLVDVEKNFGQEITGLVTGITKLGKIKYRGIERYSENLRKMFISMAQDFRTVLIKMADRLHNLKTLDVLPKEKAFRIALETLEIYAPIANRLGMGHMKGELEDYSFPYVYPKEYEWMQQNIIPRFKPKIEYIDRVIKQVKKELERHSIKIDSIHGRQKRLYSLYQKLQRPQYEKDLSKIYDLVAVRIIAKDTDDCYKVLGVIHNQFKPMPGRIKDYIAQPKPNHYQSIHTTVFGPDNEIVEFQIRTSDMHEEAEYGIAAHWQHKELSLRGKGYTVPKKLKWVIELVNWQKEIRSATDFLKSVKKFEAFATRIFVFTPNGDVIDMPEGATPVDFAFHIHTEVGNKCAGSKINGEIANLGTPLKNGDVVEIIIDKNRKGPSRDWLKFAKTNMARYKIRTGALK